ncbi:phospholipid-transporting ATPase 8 [Spatholobus suberectus]|nr:phospholipid-transporting ATPase 8 [Spatholobus suberectus]
MLYGYLIPISLYVSIEIVKVLQSIFINQDQEMYYEDKESGEISYEAESPDEAAFVIAARELGFARTQTSISLHELNYESGIKDHIKRYADVGLRTLVITYHELDEEEYELWDKEFSGIKASVTADQDALVDASAAKMERDLILLGATAVEDRLQKGLMKFILFT